MNLEYYKKNEARHKCKIQEVKLLNSVHKLFS
jgi:hypothetical protein